MFEKHLWKSDILSKDAGHIIPLPQVFFKHFANKNQLPGFYIGGTLVENGLKTTKQDDESYLLKHYRRYFPVVGFGVP